MAYIKLDPTLPGIIGLLAFRPETAKPLTELAEVLLRGPSTLTMGERETIAATVSAANGCAFCTLSHTAAAEVHMTDDNMLDSKPSDKMVALIAIALAVQQSGLAVSEEDIISAKNADATDQEIHDTVLIAAAFCMFNRYVDGLGTWAPDDKEAYAQMGEKMAHQGYVTHPAVPAEA